MLCNLSLKNSIVVTTIHLNFTLESFLEMDLEFSILSQCYKTPYNHIHFRCINYDIKDVWDAINDEKIVLGWIF